MIDVDKFVASLMKYKELKLKNIKPTEEIEYALRMQGLEYKDGEIVKTQRRVAAEAKEAIFDDDERIRKHIVTFLLEADKMGDAPSEVAEWLAWLEQQKEYVSTDFDYVWERTDCGSLTSSLDKYSEEAIKKVCHAWYDKGIELERKSWLKKQKYTQRDVDDAYLKGVTDTKNELEKQGEKLPVGFYYVNSNGEKFYADTFKYGDVVLHVKNQDEQKPLPENSVRKQAAEFKESLYLAPCADTINGITMSFSQSEVTKTSEQDELTEFKEEFMAIIDSWCGGNGYVYAQRVKEGVRNDVNKLLALARKQILSELPKWRKDNPSATTLYIKYGDYYMEIKELDKIFKMLIKEE